MSLAELRSQLREFRKTTSSPISKMKKADVVLELEKYKKPVPESVIEKPVKEKVVKEKVEKPVKEKVEKPVKEKVVKEKVEKPVKEKVVKDKPVEEKAEVKVSIKSAPRKKKD